MISLRLHMTSVRVTFCLNCWTGGNRFSWIRRTGSIRCRSRYGPIIVWIARRCGVDMDGGNRFRLGFWFRCNLSRQHQLARIALENIARENTTTSCLLTAALSLFVPSLGGANFNTPCASDCKKQSFETETSQDVSFLPELPMTVSTPPSSEPTIRATQEFCKNAHPLQKQNINNCFCDFLRIESA